MHTNKRSLFTFSLVERTVIIFKDNIFLSIKLDKSKDVYYGATLFDVNMTKIESYCKSGRLMKLDKTSFSLQLYKIGCRAINGL